MTLQVGQGLPSNGGLSGIVAPRKVGVEASGSLIRGSIKSGLLRDSSIADSHVATLTTEVVAQTVHTGVLIRGHLADFQNKVKAADQKMLFCIEKIQVRSLEDSNSLESFTIIGSVIDMQTKLNKHYALMAHEALDLCEKGANVFAHATRKAIETVFDLRRQQLEVFEQALSIVQKAELHALHVAGQEVDLQLKLQEELFKEGMALLELHQKAVVAGAEIQLANKKEDHAFSLEEKKMDVEERKAAWEVRAQMYAKKLESEVEQQKTVVNAQVSMHQADTTSSTARHESSVKARVETLKVEGETQVALEGKKNERIGAMGKIVTDVAGNVLSPAGCTIM